MKPTTRIVFYWLDELNKRRSLATTYEYFKNYAIEFLEDEQLDKVRDVYYTVENFITYKLDYYNEKL